MKLKLLKPSVAAVLTTISALSFSTAPNGLTEVIFDANTPLVVDDAGIYIFTPTTDITADLKLWGAAGGSMYNNAGNPTATQCGGAGGMVTGQITLVKDQSYVLWVGEGGNHYVDAVAPLCGGGAAGKTQSTAYTGAGGGLTGLFKTSATIANALLIAGAGGGGGSAGTGSGAGAGGYPSGQAGNSSSSSSTGGGGGTQTTGGTVSSGSFGTSEAGSALQGGNGAVSYSGGAGGAGYYGGGAGKRNNTQGGPGGGGSSYYNPSYITNFSYENGNYKVPGGSADADRGTAGDVNSVTVGATAANTKGNNGRFHLTFIS